MSDWDINDIGNGVVLFSDKGCVVTIHENRHHYQCTIITPDGYVLREKVGEAKEALRKVENAIQRLGGYGED